MHLPARFSFVALAVTACGGTVGTPVPNTSAPGVVVPTNLGEGHGDGAPAELASAGAEASAAPHAGPAPRPFSNDPPDPTPLRQAEQYEYTFRFERGKVELAGVRAVRYPKPIVTARRIGRFAVELWIGHELVDRVRFDFPLLGGDEMKPGARPIYETPSLEGGSFTMTVLVPAARRARSARLVDRARRTQAELPWPPVPAGLGPATPLAAPSSSAAAGDGAPPNGGETANDAAVPASSAPAPASSAPAPTTSSAPAPASSASVTPPSSAAPSAAHPAKSHPR